MILNLCIILKKAKTEGKKTKQGKEIPWCKCVRSGTIEIFRGWSFLGETFHLLFSQMLYVGSQRYISTSYNFLMRAGKFCSSRGNLFITQRFSLVYNFMRDCQWPSFSKGISITDLLWHNARNDRYAMKQWIKGERIECKYPWNVLLLII